MTTFSQLIDKVLQDSNRPDMKFQAIAALNGTIRELHADPNSGAAIFYGENRQEDLLEADVAEGFTWDIPTPWVFQQMESVYYPARGKYATEKKPSAVFVNPREPSSEIYFYRTGPAFAFSGYGGLTAEVKLSWFEFPRELEYALPAARLVTWDVATQTYLYDPTLVTVAQQDAARLKATNWMLERYESLLLEGTKGKLWGRLGESEKGKLAYSLYSSWRPQMVGAESYIGGHVYNR